MACHCDLQRFRGLGHGAFRGWGFSRKLTEPDEEKCLADEASMWAEHYAGLTPGLTLP